MPEEPITFEFIRNIQREERTESGLTKIPEDFYQRAKSYLNQKRKISKKKKDKGLSLEAKNIERLLEDIYNRRETKILNQAIMTTRTDIPPKNLIEDEKKFFEAVVNTLKKQRGRIMKKLLKKTREKVDFNKVKFLEDVDEFLGVDMKKYGPFKKGDKSKLPSENVKVLIKRGIVKEIK